MSAAKPALPCAYKAALQADGAIRMFDGRWSGGFVDTDVLASLVESGALAAEMREGMRFAVAPPGAGVKPRAKSGPKTSDGAAGLKRHNVMLDAETVRLARAAGDGSLSLGIRRLARPTSG